MGELTGENAKSCEDQYEHATWMLGAILHGGEDLVDGERMEVEKCKCLRRREDMT